MAAKPKLHVCSIDTGGSKIHPCRRAHEALEAAGIAHVSVVSGKNKPYGLFSKGTRPELKSGFAGIYKLLGLQVVPIAVNSGPLYHRLWKRAGVITYRIEPSIPPGLPRPEAEALVHVAINTLNTP